MLDILEDYCTMRKHQFCRIDGSTGGEEREKAVEDYNAPNSQLFIFLLSTRAGGLGINLATADVVVIYDSDWNPQMDLQAQDRAHRIGQKKPVKIFRLVTEDTIEEKILDRAMKKLHLDALVIQNGRLVDKEQKLGAGEMLNAIRYGADSIFKSDGDGEYLEADIDDILKQAEQKTKQLNKKFSVAKKEGLSSSMWAFGGEDYKEKETRSKEWMGANQFVDIGKRDRKTIGTYSEADIFNDLMGTSSGTGPRKLKDITFNDFHFFDEDALRASHKSNNRPTAAVSRFRVHRSIRPFIHLLARYDGDSTSRNLITAADSNEMWCVCICCGLTQGRCLKRLVVSSEPWTQKLGR